MRIRQSPTKVKDIVLTRSGKGLRPVCDRKQISEVAENFVPVVRPREGVLYPLSVVDLACVIGVLPEASCQRGTIIDETVGAADVCQL